MTVRPPHRVALLALATGGVLAGMTGALTPTASADRADTPAVQGPPGVSRDFVGPTLVDRSRGLSVLYSPAETGPLARKIK